MIKILHNIVVVFITLLLSSSLLAQTVEYDNGTPRRPTAVTGLVVNGVTYNVTMDYAPPLDGTVFSQGLPEGEEADASIALAALLNTQGRDSDMTVLGTVVKDLANPYKGCLVFDIDTGQDDWQIDCSPFQFPAGRDDVALLHYQQMINTNNQTIPTMSQWGLLIFGLVILNLSVFFVVRRELI